MRLAEDWAKAFPSHTNNDDRVIERLIRKVQSDALEYAAEVVQGTGKQSKAIQRLLGDARRVEDGKYV